MNNREGKLVPEKIHSRLV